jgi:hypothetical protein
MVEYGAVFITQKERDEEKERLTQKLIDLKLDLHKMQLLKQTLR